MQQILPIIKTYIQILMGIPNQAIPLRFNNTRVGQYSYREAPFLSEQL
jgi:hypothetical protein